jgi:hypothetical protein
MTLDVAPPDSPHLPDSPDLAAMPVPSARPSLLRWLHEGARTLLFRLPRWERLTPGPVLVAALVLLHIAVTIGVSRLYVGAGAIFHWRSGLAGWTGTVLMAWACYVLRPVPDRTAGPAAAPGAVHLFTIIEAQTLCLSTLSSLVYLALTRSGWIERAPAWVQWTPWVVTMAWSASAVVVVMLRTGSRHALRRVVAVSTFAVSALLAYYLAPAPLYWSEPTAIVAAAGADAQANAGPDAERGASTTATEEESAPVFSQEAIEAQVPVLARQLAALKPQRPGIADMYTLTFAPFEGEEVFRRESRMVNEVMARRFDAAGRGIALINHAQEVDTSPWATPLNLQRAIQGIAGTMDLSEDVLFIHLTSHGADDGELAANFWPLDVAPVTPPDLRRWLDEAGIKHRVISISACFAGNWIAPLASDDTLVMTSSDADHTSYGCGKKSALTFFGRAMYDEQIRSETLSFEKAHAAARLIIDKREKEAGKDDGYSNPQIKVGANIRAYLEKLQARLGG